MSTSTISKATPTSTAGHGLRDNRLAYLYDYFDRNRGALESIGLVGVTTCELVDVLREEIDGWESITGALEQTQVGDPVTGGAL